MTDKELLELSAKAAGITHDGVGYVSPTGLPMNWNPLTDDGDALRLAVKLQLDIEFINGDAIVLRAVQGGGDPYDDARRAIVRAAAMIAAQQVGR